MHELTPGLATCQQEGNSGLTFCLLLVFMSSYTETSKVSLDCIGKIVHLALSAHM
jgi:hypothetical protein